MEYTPEPLSVYKYTSVHPVSLTGEPGFPYYEEMDYHSRKRAVVGFWQQHRRMPGYQEFMKLLGVKSKNSVYKFVEKMVDEGVLEKDLQGRLTPGRELRGVPLLGVVEAGFPTPAEEEMLDTMDFDEYLTPNKESSYVLKVKGDSMIEAGIHPGDLVIVERKPTYKVGQIVIASIEGEYTMKYLRKKNEHYYLEPANSAYKPIYPKSNLNIEAVVTAIVRKY